MLAAGTRTSTKSTSAWPCGASSNPKTGNGRSIVTPCVSRGPGAKVRLGKEEVPKSRRACLRFQLVDDRRRPPVVSGRKLVAIGSLVWVDELDHEIDERLL